MSKTTPRKIHRYADFQNAGNKGMLISHHEIVNLTEKKIKLDLVTVSLGI